MQAVPSTGHTYPLLLQGYGSACPELTDHHQRIRKRCVAKSIKGGNAS